jgi:hypothetical protein
VQEFAMKSEETTRDPTEDELFTEAVYSRLLDLAASKYQFCDFHQRVNRPLVIWRHDVDYSPHRALALAKIEAARRLRCIYHILLTGRYYNLFEPEIVSIFRQIAKLGHEIGLHFDMDSFGESESVTVAQLDERIAFERHVIKTLVGVDVRTMSFHNYHLNRDRIHERSEICGMINIAAPAFAGEFLYVSDSNGIWRHRGLEDVLTGPALPRLHVLTHPEWWTPEPMAPSARLRRSIEGRARANSRLYLYQLARDGRLESIGERIGLTKAEMDDACADVHSRHDVG